MINFKNNIHIEGCDKKHTLSKNIKLISEKSSDIIIQIFSEKIKKNKGLYIENFFINIPFGHISNVKIKIEVCLENKNSVKYLCGNNEIFINKDNNFNIELVLEISANRLSEIKDCLNSEISNILTKNYKYINELNSLFPSYTNINNNKNFQFINIKKILKNKKIPYLSEILAHSSKESYLKAIESIYFFSPVNTLKTMINYTKHDLKLVSVDLIDNGDVVFEINAVGFELFKELLKTLSKNFNINQNQIITSIFNEPEFQYFFEGGEI